MSTVNPEHNRKSQGAAWSLNGQRKRLDTLDGQKEHTAMLITRKPGTGSTRPCDRGYARISTRGFIYAGRWYPDGHPVGALRFLLPAGEPVRPEWGVEQAKALLSIADEALLCYRGLVAARAPYSQIEPYVLALASLWGIADEQKPQPPIPKPSGPRMIKTAADVEKIVPKRTPVLIQDLQDKNDVPGNHGLADLDFGKQKKRVLDTATELVDAIRYVGAHPEIPEAWELPKGYKLFEDGKKTKLVHPSAPGVTVTVAFKGNFDLDFPSLWDVTRSEVIKLCWAVEHASPEAKLAAMAPRTRIFALHGDVHTELTFIVWMSSGMRFINELGNESTVSWDEIDRALAEKRLRIDGFAPDHLRERVTEPSRSSHYQRDPKLFVAHNARGSGGGFIPFGGDVRKWAWIRKNTVCAECGAAIGNFKSSERADGYIPNARYFTCQGVGRHVIKRETDLHWKVGAEARDQKRRLKATVDEVQAAYPWLTAAVPDAEEMPY